MLKPKPADPMVWGACSALGFAVLTFVYWCFGYVPPISEAGHAAGGTFFLGMLAAWARNLPLR